MLVRRSTENNLKGLPIIIGGLVLWVVGGAYAAYEKYSIGHSFARSISNPIVLILGFLGLVLVVTGAYLQQKKPNAPPTTKSVPSGSNTDTTSQGMSGKPN